MGSQRRRVLSFSAILRPSAHCQMLLLLSRLCLLLSPDSGVLLLACSVDFQHPFVRIFARVCANVVCPAGRYNAKGVVVLLYFDLGARVHIGHANVSQNLVFLWVRTLE